MGGGLEGRPDGLGPGRGRVLLESVLGLSSEARPGSTVYDNTCPHPVAPPPVIISLHPFPEPVSRVRVEFMTPTELKAEEEVAVQPHFGALFQRIRDRISTLRALYGAGPLDIDFRGMGERAGRVQLSGSRLEWVHATRPSTKTGRSHSLGGFIGEAEYTGDLAEFVPFLAAAYWTGVGRQTVWGKGAIRMLETS